jgi:hypothetical protein
MAKPPAETKFTILTSKSGRRWISYAPSSGVIVPITGKAEK